MVDSEVSRIMGPNTPIVSYNYQSRTKDQFHSTPNHMSPVPRRPKRKGKISFALYKYGGAKKKKPVTFSTFQKKLVVFCYMGSGSEAPDEFSRSEKLICVRGLLPAIAVNASEGEIRQEICDVITSNTSLSEAMLSDFEFVNVSGKQASIPQCKKGFKFDGRAVKELAGSGSLYVHLIPDFNL